jgi:hypothetical protein
LRRQQYAQITLAGSATDSEDGPLSGNTLVWTATHSASLQTTVLGSGNSITASLYADGCGETVYTITLTATDSTGQTGTASRQVTILEFCEGLN